MCVLFIDSPHSAGEHASMVFLSLSTGCIEERGISPMSADSNEKHHSGLSCTVGQLELAKSSRNSNIYTQTLLDRT